MILKINYTTNAQTIVILSSDILDGIYWTVVYDTEAFYERYYASGKPGGARRIHEDIIDTYLSTVESVTYTKEELLDNTKLNIINSTVHIEL